MCTMWTRRQVVWALGLAGAAGWMGCTGDARRPATVSLMAAGSLNNAFEHGLSAAIDADITLEIEAHGSATAARLIAEGQRDPDIVTVADEALFDGPLHPPWYTLFATNALVIAYNPDTPGGRRLAAAGTERWFEPLRSGDVRIGRTDPDEDPLGYRTLFMLDLADRYYEGASALREQLLTRDQIYPETGLISQFETGSIDAAFTYRNMAIERDYAYVELPPPINLSDPAFADDWYATTQYTLPSGKSVTGGVIRYASTMRRITPITQRVFQAQLTGDYLEAYGLSIPSNYPQFVGDVPDDVMV